MARYAQSMYGGAAFIRKFKLGSSTVFQTLTGVPALVAQTGTGGVVGATTGGGTDCLGCSLDTGTYTTTQSASMVEGVISVAINPDAVWAFRMSGTAAEGGSLLLTTNSAASSGGTAITITAGDAAPNSPTMLDGMAYCVSGNNVGQSRRVTTVTATVATLLVPFPNAIAAGDTFLILPFFVGSLGTLGGSNLTLTTNLTEANAITASTTSAFNARHVEIIVDTQGLPRANSYLLTIPLDHIYALNS